MIIRRLTPYQVAIDVVVAFVVGIVTIPFDLHQNHWSVLITLGMCAGLVFRRWSPGIALLLAWVTASAEMLSFSTPQVSNLAIPAILFASAAYGSTKVKWIGLVSVGIGAAVGMFYVVFAQTTLFGMSQGESGVDALVQLLLQTGITFLGFLALLGLPWVAGQLVSTRYAARTSREAQLVAEREAARAEGDVARAEREAARAELDMAVEQERSRIARDMHDVVAHSLAVVIAQADGARYQYRADPESVEGSASPTRSCSTTRTPSWPAMAGSRPQSF